VATGGCSLGRGERRVKQEQGKKKNPIVQSMETGKHQEENKKKNFPPESQIKKEPKPAT